MKTLKTIIKEEINNFDDTEWIENIGKIDPLSWLRINFPDLTIGSGDNRFDKIWYAGEIPIIGLVSIDDQIWISDDRIWGELASEFSLDYLETRDLIRVWLEEDYKLKVIRPVRPGVLN